MASGATSATRTHASSSSDSKSSSRLKTRSATAKKKRAVAISLEGMYIAAMLHIMIGASGYQSSSVPADCCVPIPRCSASQLLSSFRKVGGKVEVRSLSNARKRLQSGPPGGIFSRASDVSHLTSPQLLWKPHGKGTLSQAEGSCPASSETPVNKQTIRHS